VSATPVACAALSDVDATSARTPLVMAVLLVLLVLVAIVVVIVVVMMVVVRNIQ